MAIRIPVNPKLPARFDDTPNDRRPASHLRWLGKPYIVTDDGGKVDKAEWLTYWPLGIRYDVRCLDGGAWDRSTWLGSFKRPDEAIRFATSMVESGEIERRVNTFSSFAGVI